MSENAIVVEKLSKSYLIGHRLSSGRQYNYTALRDVMGHEIRNFVRKTVDVVCGRQVVQGDAVEEFWALKDISFEVKQGEVFGIIGRNGAGKSTLLKILSRITEPTEGRMSIQGRIASLLEVGTGFHPELTGRENIFLNGAILGMTQREIRKKFDEIVAFAEVERFLDTPVKHYSSGMYVRLAFAVAAHLEPEILLIDEVLAVGDIEFQRKCLGKMDQVSRREGRTVLFVSHNLAAVSALCTRGILVVDGRLAYCGSVDGAIERYSNASVQGYSISFPVARNRPFVSRINVDSRALIDRNLVVDIGFESPWPLTPIGGIGLRTIVGEPVWGSNGRFHPSPEQAKSMHCGILRCEARHLPLVPGEYLLSVWLADWDNDYDSKIDVLRIRIGVENVNRLRPPASLIGYLDSPAVWHAIRREEVQATN
jgi:lipopolysaccharide transport system ATP-binding protein